MQYRYANARTGKTTGDGSEVGLFIPLPPGLAQQFPSLGEEDKSPAHCTFLFLGEVPLNEQHNVLDTIQEVLEDLQGPVRAELMPMDYFDHPGKNRRVAVCPVRFSHDLAALRWKVRDRLIAVGCDVADSFPLVYRPHVTLAYLDGLYTRYREQVPTGGWVFDSIQLWGLPELHKIQFGNSTQKVATRFTRRSH